MNISITTHTGKRGAKLFLYATALLTLSSGVTRAEETGWVSEEFGSAICKPTQAATQVECRGSYCDQIRLYCNTMPGGLMYDDQAETAWVEYGGNWLGEGNQKDAVCLDGYWATGIECMGDFCDNVRLLCTRGTRSHGDCEWTPDLWSEESGIYRGKPGYFLAGVHCEGTHCDNKRYYVCSARAAAASCGNTGCNGPSPDGTCYCDEACAQWDDCCDDYTTFCG